MKFPKRVHFLRVRASEDCKIVVKNSELCKFLLPHTNYGKRSDHKNTMDFVCIVQRSGDSDRGQALAGAHFHEQCDPVRQWSFSRRSEAVVRKLKRFHLMLVGNGIDWQCVICLHVFYLLIHVSMWSKLGENAVHNCKIVSLKVWRQSLQEGCLFRRKGLSVQTVPILNPDPAAVTTRNSFNWVRKRKHYNIVLNCTFADTKLMC